MVQAWEEGHLSLNAAELLAGRVHLDPFNGIVAAVQLVLDLQVYRSPRTHNHREMNTERKRKEKKEEKKKHHKSQYLNEEKGFSEKEMISQHRLINHLDYCSKSTFPEQLELLKLTEVTGELFLHHCTKRGAEKVTPRDNRRCKIHIYVWK